MRKTRKAIGVIFVIFSIIMFARNIDLGSSLNNPIQVLAIIDDNYGANAPEIIDRLEGYGWIVTIAGLEETVISCNFYGNTPQDTDVLIPNIDNVTSYDVVTVLPGLTHVNLMNNQDALDLIKEASDAGVVICGWCKAVRVLAQADILDGKNVTGDAGFINEYEAAGATYVGFVLPVIDGNLVTCVRSYAWQPHGCAAIGKALGVFEDDPPTMGEISIEFDEKYPTIITLSIELNDATSIRSASIRVFEINETSGERISDSPSYTEDLFQQEAGVYVANFMMDYGLFEVDLRVLDYYYNELSFTNCTMVNISIIETTETNLYVISSSISIILIATIFTINKRKRQK